MFSETIEHLAPVLCGTNLFCIDLNGHGKTVTGRKTFTLWDQAEDVISLMDELNLDKVTVVGVSIGALIALRLALAYPSRITALILLAALATERNPATIAGMIEFRDIWVSTSSPSEDIMNAAIRGWGGNPDVTSTRAQRIKSYWVQRHSGPENIDAILQSLNEIDDIRGRLSGITVPVLIMHGELDKAWPLAEAEVVRDRLINAKVRFEVVKGGRHLVLWMRDSKDISRVVGEFVQEVLAGNCQSSRQ